MMIEGAMDLIVGYFLALEILCLKYVFFGRLCHTIASVIFIGLVVTIFFPPKASNS